MALDQVIFLGKAVVLLAACLELRHLVAAIRKHFEGCRDLRAAVARAANLDDATAVGLVVCALIAVGIVVTIYGEVIHAGAS